MKEALIKFGKKLAIFGAVVLVMVAVKKALGNARRETMNEWHYRRYYANLSKGK